MANFFKYIDKYKDFDFNNKQFNDVDNLILSELAYINFTSIVSDNHHKITLKKAAELFFQNYSYHQYAHLGITMKEAYKMLKRIYNTKRFGELLLSNYIYIGNDAEQFSAMKIKLTKKISYIVYEGTDYLISGWKEDFTMAYKFPVSAQISAVNYLNRVVKLFDRKIYVGGHSKGGNLALVASMFAKKSIKKKIIKIYNNDGPGLRKAQIESEDFKSIKDKLILIVPNYTVFGLMFRHPKEYIVVKSSRMDIMSHSVLTWQIDDDKLKTTILSRFSKNLDNSIIKWLDTHDDEQRKQLIDPLFNAFDNANITNVYDLKDIKKMINLIKNMKNLDKSTKDLALDCLKFNLEYCLKTK